MKGQDYEQLRLFPVDFHANHSALPDTSEERKMTVTSGRKCLELYKNSNQIGCLVRMCLESSIWHSTRCLLNWKVSATNAKRLLFRLAVSMHRTEGTGSSFWPTPVHGHLAGGTGAMQMLKLFLKQGKITEQEYRSFVAGNGGKTNPELVEWLMGYEKAFTQLIPTPTASAYKGPILKRYFGGGVLPSEIGRTCRTHSAWENWPDEPRICRVVDGIPNRVDRIKCLGEAVVPQAVYPFFEWIAEIEKGDESSEPNE